jgi:biopolymer transport protein ExbD
MWSPSRAANQRSTNRKSPAFIFINMWPFVAVMVALLMLFMSRTRLHPYRQIPADIPKSTSATPQPGARREDAIEIFVTRDGAVYFRHSQILLHDLAPAVQTAVREGAEKKVYISADSRAKNGDVESVVDELRRAGITEISFLTN